MAITITWLFWALFEVIDYRVTGGLRLGWVDLDLGSSPPLVGRYCSYLLPKQDGGTSQIHVNPTKSQTTRVTLYKGSELNNCGGIMPVRAVHRQEVHRQVLWTKEAAMHQTGEES